MLCKLGKLENTHSMKKCSQRDPYAGTLILKIFPEDVAVDHARITARSGGVADRDKTVFAGLPI